MKLPAARLKVDTSLVKLVVKKLHSPRSYISPPDSVWKPTADRTGVSSSSHQNVKVHTILEYAKHGIIIGFPD